jgi:hypothetical protein
MSLGYACRHRKNMANTLKDTYEVVDALDIVVGAVFHTLAIFACVSPAYCFAQIFPSLFAEYMPSTALE